MEHDNAISMLESLSQGKTEPRDNTVQQMEIVTPRAYDYCEAPEPTKSNPINVGNLVNAGGDVITFDITNGAPAPVRIIFGLGLLNRTGIPALFGILNASVDEPLATDDFGAGTAKMEFFSEFTNGHSYIASSLKIFVAAGTPQRSIAPAFATITPNGDFLETKAKNIRDNSDLNYIELAGCHIPLTFYQGVTYIVNNGVSLDAEVIVGGIDMIGDFAPSLKG